LIRRPLPEEVGYKVTGKALWRRFEAATLEERLTMVSTRWVTDFDMGIVPQPPNVEHYVKSGEQFIQVLTDDPDELILLRPGEDGHGVTWRRFIVYDERWIRLRRSFIQSPEWRAFRLAWLDEHPACARCDRTYGSLHIHHVSPYTLRLTVLDEGFLEGLRHPERFKTMCGDHHIESHPGLTAGKVESALPVDAGVKCQENRRSSRENDSGGETDEL